MKNFGKLVLIFLFFFVGTVSLFHVDRQSGQTVLAADTFTQRIENFIEKQGDLL